MTRFRRARCGLLLSSDLKRVSFEVILDRPEGSGEKIQSKSFRSLRERVTFLRTALGVRPLGRR